MGGERDSQDLQWSDVSQGHRNGACQAVVIKTAILAQTCPKKKKDLKLVDRDKSKNKKYYQKSSICAETKQVLNT